MTNQQLNYLSVVSVVSVSISAWKLPRKFWCFIFKYCWRLSFMILLLTMYNTWGPKWMAMPLPLKRKSVNVRVLCSSLAKCRLPSWGKNTLRWGSWIQWIPPYSSYRNCLVSTNMSDLLVNESIVKLENDSSLGGLISENKVSLPDFTLALHPPGWIWIQLMLLAEITIVELLKRKRGSLPPVWSLVRSKSHWLHLFDFSPPVCFQMWKRWSLPLVWSGGSDVGPPSINWQCNTMHTVQQCTLHHNAARCAVKNTVQ